MSQFIWMVFTDSEKIQSYHLNIPYDCDFIIIQSLHGFSYKLTELYQVEKSKFYLDFGNWASNRSSITSKFKYRRRANLNGTKILMVSSPYVIT